MALHPAPQDCVCSYGPGLDVGRVIRQIRRHPCPHLHQADATVAVV